MGTQAKGELNRGPHLETCREGSYMFVRTCPTPAEPKRGVRMQKNTKEHYRAIEEESEGKKKTFSQMHKLLYPND